MSESADPEPVIPKLSWRQMLIAAFILLAYVAATRFYELDSPLWQKIVGSHRVDPDTLHLHGEFVENNLGTAREADGSYTLRMIAQQYMFVPHCVRIPAGAPVHLRITSADGAHTLTATGLDINVKVVPGFVTQALLQVPQPGVFAMPCSEFCGTGHFTMISRLEVVPSDKFQELRPTDRVACGAP